MSRSRLYDVRLITTSSLYQSFRANASSCEQLEAMGGKLPHCLRHEVRLTIISCPRQLSSMAHRFPDDIPSAVSVPQWAYLDVTTDNDFNVTAALSLANEHKPDATSSSFSSGGDSTSTHKKSIVGPVVGGVVGGIGGLALVGLGIWFWLRRRNQRKENTPAPGVVTFDNSGTPVPQSTPDIEKPGYIHAPSPLSAVDGVQQLQQQPLLSYSGVSPEQQQYQQQQALLANPLPSTLRPYVSSLISIFHLRIERRRDTQNPDDPSTFPDALLYSPPSTQTYTPSGQTSPTSYNTPLSSTQNRPLSSVPEVSNSHVPEVSSGYVPEVSSGYVPPAQHQHQQQTGGGYQPTEF